MVVSLKKHFATETRSLEWCLKEYPKIEKDATEVIQQIKSKHYVCILHLVMV